jgi:hypothetical protein
MPIRIASGFKNIYRQSIQYIGRRSIPDRALTPFTAMALVRRLGDLLQATEGDTAAEGPVAHPAGTLESSV